MRKLLSGLIFLFSITTPLYAGTTPDFNKVFANKSACFLLFDVQKNKIVQEYNPQHCQKQLPPDSTFKIPLSLMAFDQNVITQNTVFKWNGKDKGFSFWNHDQTPKTWLSNSAVWVSQAITPQLGRQKLKDYLAKFDYGNQNLQGDPGKHNGLTHAWLSSSLKISAAQQLNFLIKFIKEDLPVNKQAIKNTKENMLVDKSLFYIWKLYGKTGSGVRELSNGKALRDGWFIGFVERFGKKYVFVLDFTDQFNTQTSEPGGIAAEKMARNILTDLGLI